MPSINSRMLTEENSYKTTSTTNANSTTLDEYIPALATRPILTRYTEPSALLTPLTPQRILAPQQDRAVEEPEIGIPQNPPTSIEDRSSDSETPIHQVQPVLGMTPTENLQLKHRNRPEDIADVLVTTAFKGYVNTPDPQWHTHSTTKMVFACSRGGKTTGRGYPHRKAK